MGTWVQELGNVEHLYRVDDIGRGEATKNVKLAIKIACAVIVSSYFEFRPLDEAFLKLAIKSDILSLR